MLSKPSQAQKDKYSMISHTLNLSNLISQKVKVGNGSKGEGDGKLEGC